MKERTNFILLPVQVPIRHMQKFPIQAAAVMMRRGGKMEGKQDTTRNTNGCKQ
jgi:hypothetical protein